MTPRARRSAVATLGAAIAMALVGGWAGRAAAQLGQSLGPRTPAGTSRPAVDESLRRTVELVLRAAARRGGLPPTLTDPEPLPEATLETLRVGARLDPDFPAEALPAAINDRLPHVRGGSVWVSAGTWLVEIDPVRLTVLTVAPDMLPPVLDGAR